MTWAVFSAGSCVQGSRKGKWMSLVSETVSHKGTVSLTTAANKQKDQGDNTGTRAYQDATRARQDTQQGMRTSDK